MEMGQVMMNYAATVPEVKGVSGRKQGNISARRMRFWGLRVMGDKAACEGMEGDGSVK